MIEKAVWFNRLFCCFGNKYMNEKIIERFYIVDVYQPQDIDKSKGLVARLCVKAIEMHKTEDDERIFSSIQFLINGQDCSIFQSSINFVGRVFSISSDNLGNGDICLDYIKQPKSHKIATYFMCQIVQWLQGFKVSDAGNFNMKPIKLTQEDGRGQNGIRRNRLYENMGIKIVKGEGVANLNEILQRNSWMENIVEYKDIQEFVKNNLNEKNQLESRIKCLENTNSYQNLKIGELQKYKNICMMMGVFILFLIILCYLLPYN